MLSPVASSSRGMLSASKYSCFSQGYESFWAFSQAKKGFSGVATFIREEYAPQQAAIDFIERYVGDGKPEGRAVATFHNDIVIVNVYVPNG